MTLLDAGQALHWTTRLVAIGVLIDTLEQIFSGREYKPDGIFAWGWLRTSRMFARRLTPRRLLDLIFNPPLLQALFYLRAARALLLIAVPLTAWISGAALLLTFVIGSLLNLRNSPYGVEAHNRLSLVIIGALLLQRAAPDSVLVTSACLWFVALQACLSYVTAGVAKLRNQGWRSGSGLVSVATATTLGVPPRVARLLREHQRLAGLLTRFTILMECAFPLLLVLPAPLGFVFIAWGLLFHLAIARLLGLNKFFWAWVATYPALLFAVQH
jgi:hypothetical protein